MREKRSILAAVATVLLVPLVLSLGGSAGEYTVTPGDTLSEIAERFGLTVEELAEANGIVDPDHILSGQVLLVPGAAGGRGAEPSPAPAPGPAGSYTVQRGDTLSGISARFGVSIAVIMEANGLTDPHFIVEGQVLTIPSGDAAPASPASPVAPEIEALLEEFAAAEGVDPGLVKALAYLESGWQQHVVSATGAIGVMQIQPSTGYWLENYVFGYDLNLETSAYDNIKAGVRYLRILLDLSGDMDQAMAAYYQGYGSLAAGILYEDTILYVADVKAIRERFWP